MFCGSLTALILGLTILDVYSGINAFRVKNVPRSVTRPQSNPGGLRYSRYPVLNSTNLEPVHFKQYGSKRKLVRYGPYKAPPFSTDNGMKEFTEMDAEKPCQDCLITAIQAGLEYPNSSYANANSGMWLHHIVLYDFGRKDVACPDLPYRFFASGNERTPLDMTLDDTSLTGFPLLSNSTMGITLMLMNEVFRERDAVLTVDFEYIPTMRKEFKPLDAIWLDITGVCGDSEIKVPASQAVFEYHTPDIRLNSTGRIVAAGGHLHDGGVLVKITKNKETLCDFTPHYGETPGYVDNLSGHTSAQLRDNIPAPDKASPMSPMTHISSMPLCYYVGTYKPGDELGIVAYYNTTKHEAMIGSKGGLEPVMGIAIAYLQNDPQSGPLASPRGPPSAPLPPPQSAPISSVQSSPLPSPESSPVPPPNSTSLPSAESSPIPPPKSTSLPSAESSPLPSAPMSTPTVSSPLPNTSTAKPSPSTSEPSVSEVSPHSETVPQTTSATSPPPVAATTSSVDIPTTPSTLITKPPSQSVTTPKSSSTTKAIIPVSTSATALSSDTQKPAAPAITTTASKSTGNSGLITIMTINPGGTTVMTILPVPRLPTQSPSRLGGALGGGLFSWLIPKSTSRTRRPPPGFPTQGFPGPGFPGFPKGSRCPLGVRCKWTDAENEEER